MAYDNTNSGALFKNEKDGVETRPDYKGQINVNGTDFWLSAWLKKSKDGKVYMSLSVQPKDGKTAPAPRGVQAQKAPPEPRDEIPF